MSKNVLFTGWNRVVPGKEAHAGELFASSIAFWTKRQEAGEIDSFEPVILSPHGGDMNGFFIVRGERAKLDKIQASDAWLELSMRCGNILVGFGAITGYTNQGVQEIMGLWQKTIAS